MPMSESRLKQLNDEIYEFKEPNIAKRIQIFDEVRNLLRHGFTNNKNIKACVKIPESFF